MHAKYRRTYCVLAALMLHLLYKPFGVLYAFSRPAIINIKVDGDTLVMLKYMFAGNCIAKLKRAECADDQHSSAAFFPVPAPDGGASFIAAFGNPPASFHEDGSTRIGTHHVQTVWHHHAETMK